VNQHKVLAWLLGHASEPVLYSDVSRALITNDREQRMRSRDARVELHDLLREMQIQGVLRLHPLGPRRGLRIEVIHTQEERNP
jgi:hypothetical protein